MVDLAVSVGTSLANDLFGSLNYPFRIRVDGNALVVSEALTGEAKIDWLPPGSPEEDGGFVADLDPLLSATIEAYLDNQSVTAFVTAEQDEAAAALIEPYGGDGAADVAAIKGRMAQDQAFAGKMEAFLKSRLEAGIDWVEAELSQMPRSAMGNPVTLSDLRLAVRARAKACIRVFGREICVSATSPWIRFDGRQAALFLDAEGTKIYGRARVSDLDFVLTIRILGREIKIRIGVTGLLNRELAKQRPLLADFATIRITVPGVKRVYQATSVAAPASGSETRLEVDGRFSPA